MSCFISEVDGWWFRLLDRGDPKGASLKEGNEELYCVTLSLRYFRTSSGEMNQAVDVSAWSSGERWELGMYLKVSS